MELSDSSNYQLPPYRSFVNSRMLLRDCRRYAITMSHAVKKLVVGLSDQVRHMPRCTATEDDKRLGISNVECNREADLHLCFRI